MSVCGARHEEAATEKRLQGVPAHVPFWDGACALLCKLHSSMYQDACTWCAVGQVAGCCCAWVARVRGGCLHGWDAQEWGQSAINVIDCA